MPDSLILPGARARLVDEAGRCTAEYYRFLQRLGPSADVSALSKRVDDLASQLDGGGAFLPSSTRLLAGVGIAVGGTLAQGVVTVSLQDIVQQTGGILQKFAVDGQGRVFQTETATTDDLPEGSTNRYFTAARAQDAAGAALRDTPDVDLAYDAANHQISAALTPTGVTAGTYGGGVSVPVVQVDTKGRLVGIAVQALIAGSGVTFTTDPVTGAVTISVNTTPSSNRVTEDGNQRITRNGDVRVTR